MDFREIDADDEYNTCCGELFVTVKGVIVFHCALCTFMCTGYEKFENHVRTEHLWTNEVYFDDANIGNDVEYVSIEQLEEYEQRLDEEPAEPENTSDTDFSENGDNENLLEKLLDYNKKQEQRKAVNITDKQVCTLEPRAKRSRTDRNVSTVQRVLSKTNEQGKVQDSSKSDSISTVRFPELPSCDRPQLKQLRNLSSALTDKERVHKCPFCEFASKDKTNLWSHVQRHSNNKPHKCEYCPKAFHTKTELIFHTRSHTGERPFLCDDCGRAFVTKQQLKQHIKRHKNERDYNCTECDKKFYSKQDLSAHMTVHTKETPFKCNLCESVFTRRKALSAHRKLHENKRAYQCQICGMAYNQGAGLYLHMKSKHKLVKKEDENMADEVFD